MAQNVSSVKCSIYQIRLKVFLIQVSILLHSLPPTHHHYYFHHHFGVIINSSLLSLSCLYMHMLYQNLQISEQICILHQTDSLFHCWKSDKVQSPLTTGYPVNISHRAAFIIYWLVSPSAGPGMVPVLSTITINTSCPASRKMALTIQLSCQKTTDSV